MGRSGNVKTCTECPKEVREELWEIFNEKQHKDAATYQRVVQDARDILGDSDEERALNEGFEETIQTTSSVVGRKKKGTVSIKSVDESDFVKTSGKIFELLDVVMKEVGEENIMQVITDNENNYVLAGKMLEMKRPKIYWTPCAAHCIDLMLEDIKKLHRIKMTIKRAISIVGFIYVHSSTLSLMRHFTKKRELMKHAVTRFATSYLSLERLYEEKANLRKMFVSDEWTTNKLSKETKGKEVTKLVLMPSFWKNVTYIMKVMGPLVKVLRLVDSEKKAVMSYIYEAMDKAKEAIINAFNENKYKDVFKIIDER
ncbi:PREDICTED: uncharacterized protein LOC109335489 [Lupinus angustifolius]|uniref:uncharacterized protein LOC109335489 n=1 Tax=Lupinus angustifolius TaxID=3871 RepID=UPI00092FD353|nr:PREDICTED: uncharacterized protein LOC109335489 [Lupinus angustifolius]